MVARPATVAAGPAPALAPQPGPLARELEGVWAVWARELTVYRREKPRVVSSLVQPLLWIFVFGGGLGSAIELQGTSYRTFIFPGIVIMATMFTCVFYGLYIVWDRKLDVLKQILVSPVSRVAIFTGKVLGGSTDALIQATLLCILGVVLMPIRLGGVPAALGLVALAAVGLTALGLAIGSFFEDPESFQVVFSFLVFPMFMLSGAVYPLTGLPGWLRVATRLDPLTYAVDALRGVLLHRHAFPLAADIGAMALFAAAMVVVGTWAFSRAR